MFMHTSQLPDAVLIDRFRNGDDGAMDALVQRYRCRVCAYANRLSHDRDMADDVVSGTFVRVNRFAAQFRGESAFSAWVHTLARNYYLDLRRKSLMHVTERLEQPNAAKDGSSVRPFESTAPSPHELAEKRERERLLTIAIGKLPDQQRDLVQLFHVNQLGYEEIAGLMRLPIGTIKSRLHRARLALRRILECERLLLAPET
jgi:RNA polymerase sigma-70 factor (ECF subfamily)